MKRTWQPKKKIRLKKHGFLSLMKRARSKVSSVIKKRRQKGRHLLTVQPHRK